MFNSIFNLTKPGNTSYTSIKKKEKIMAKTKGIYQRGNIYWIRYTGCDSRKRFESSKSTSFKVAEKLLIKRLAELLTEQ